MTIYGITNCKQTQKAISWFEEMKVSYVFHDFKKLGITAEKLTEWSNRVGYEALLNKNGMSWKQLSQDLKANIKTESEIFAMLEKRPILLKRPIVEYENSLVIGFNQTAYASRLI